MQQIPTEESVATPAPPSRIVYASLGLCGGFAVGVWAMIEGAKTYRGLQILVLLLAGMVFGTLAGLNLHSSRSWGSGKAVFTLRWTMACGGAAGLIAFVGYLIGMVAREEVWQLGSLGALYGFGLALRWLYEDLRAAA